MDNFNPFSRTPKANRVIGAVRSIPLWFRPVFKPESKPEDWKVIKLSEDRTGYVKTSDLHSA